MNEPVVALDHVAFSYDGQPVLEDVTFSIAANDFVCLVGPNGGGKTTLLKLLVGLLTPTSGTVRLFGRRPEAARPRLGYMPQHAQVDPHFPASVTDVVLMGRLAAGRGLGPFSRADRQAAHEALQQVELYDLRRRPFADLSGGQRQRVLIARALAGRPDLLLLDEPTSNLDVHMEIELFDVLERLNQRLTILVVSHDLGFVSQYVKTVVCVKHRVVVHPTSAITGEIIQQIYGADVRLVRHDHRCAEGGHECLNS